MTTTVRSVAIFTIFLLVTLACARTGRLTPATPTAPVGLPAGETTRTLTHDNRERSYLLYVPASVDWSAPAPLVFVFHGGSGNARSAVVMSGFNAVADDEGFVVVYPNGSSRLSDNVLLTWNGGDCCAFAQEANIDDVGFVRAIAAELQVETTIDPKRIYATGMSNGGILSHRLACEAADLFAAVAPVAGTLNFSPCTPSQPISVIEFHGSADQNIPFEGGAGPNSVVEVDFASVPDSIDFWAAVDGCDPEPRTDAVDDVEHAVWSGCTDATAVELYTIIGGGHAWPGGTRGRPEADRPTGTISASGLMWAFFAAHPRP